MLYSKLTVGGGIWEEFQIQIKIIFESWQTEVNIPSVPLIISNTGLSNSKDGYESTFTPTLDTSKFPPKECAPKILAALACNFI
jgi:hypothetical protein